MNLVRRKLFPILKSYLFIFISYFLATLLLTGCSADRNRPGYDSQSQTGKVFDGRDGSNAVNTSEGNLKQEDSKMRMTMSIDDTVLTVSLIDSETTREFISQLPETIQMRDYYSRIKWSYFSEPISVNGPKQLEYEIGDVAYWPEGNELLIYYKSDGKPMRSDIIVMGKIESGVEVFEKYSGNVNISFRMIYDSK